MEGKVIRTKVPIAQPGVISIIEDTEEVYICFEDGSVKKLVSVVTDQNKPADFLLDVQNNTLIPAHNLGGYAQIVYSNSEPENPTVGTIWVKEDGTSYIYDGVEWSKINRLTSEDIGISLDLSLFPFTTNISFSTSGLTISWNNSTITVIQPNNNINFSVSSGSTNLSANKTYYIFAQLDTSNNTASIVFSEQALTTANTLLIGGAKTDSSRVVQVFVGTIVQKQEIDALSGLISATQLGKEVQPYVSSIQFSATSSTVVSYTSGSIKFLDGSSYSVSSGSFTISQDGVYYIYFQISGSSATLNISTNIADSVGANKGLLAVCTRSNNTISVLPFSSGGGTINSNLIAANAITANHIQANSISSNHITSSAITSDKIAANAVTSDKIAANAVVADKIAANAVTAEKLAASTTRFWYADNLQFSIVSNRIRATFTTLAIYSGKDATEATATSPIDADATVSDGNWYLWYDYDGATKFKISTATTVNSNFQPNADLLIAKIVVSGGQISQVVNLFNGTVIDGAVIKTDTIEARHIKANSISADKLAVGTIGNLLPYKYATFEVVDINALRAASNNSTITTTTTAFDGSQAISASLSTTQFVVIPYGNDVILVNPNTVYTFSAACRRSSTGTSSLVIEILNAADNSVITSSTTSISTTYTRCAVSFTAPSSGKIKVRFRTTSSTAATIFIDACQLEEGSIPASSIKYRPPAVTYIDGAQIVTGAITADKLNVSQLSAISANLGDITAGNISGVNISGSTITGGTFKTATSGQRIEMYSDYANTIFGYSGNSNESSPGRLSFYSDVYETGAVFQAPVVLLNSRYEYSGSITLTPKASLGGYNFSFFDISTTQFDEDYGQTLGSCSIGGIIRGDTKKSYVQITSEASHLKIRPDTNNTRLMSNQPIVFTNSGIYDEYTDYQSIECKNITAYGLIGNFPYYYQELSSDLALSAGSGWYTFTGNGISYLSIGNVSSGTIVDFSGAVRATTGDSSDYSIAAVITSGPSTVIKQFTVATLRSGQSGTIAFKYKFSSSYSDVRIYLRIWRGTSTTATIKAGTDPEKTTWMSATVYK